MPYLKIKVANDGKDTDWTTINSLDLSTLNVNGTTTIKGSTTIGDATKNTNILTINTNTNAATFKSTGTDTNNKTQSIEISNGELKIQSPGKNALNLGDYLNLNTSGCTVGSSDGEEPSGYDWPGSGKTPKKGDLFIQLKTVGEGEKQTTYSLLWYYDSGWKQVHAIWG